MTTIAGIVLLLAGQTQTIATPTVASVESPPIAATLVLPRDTPVELMAMREVSTDKAEPGTPIKLRINKPVLIEGRPIIPAGTPAFGEVIAARDAGGLGKSGTMAARLTHIQFGDTRIPLDGNVSAKGTGAGSTGAAIVLSGLVGLFHRGNNAKIKAGEIIAGFVAEDVTLPPPAVTP
jgi:hypothetical protein